MSDPISQSAREVTVTELRRGAAAVIGRVQRGEVAVISRHGRPVAIMVSLSAPDALQPIVVQPETLRALAKVFERRAFHRRMSELMHGRWWNGGGIHGPYR